MAAWADRVPEGTRWAIVLLFAAAVTPVLLWKHPVGDYFVETDFYGGYEPGARALLARGLDPVRYGVVGPVYEIVLAALKLTGLDLFRAAQFLSLASMTATIAIASGWLEKRLGRGAGWVSALLLTTNPTVVRYAYTASTDALYLALLTAAFACTFPAPGESARMPRLALAGALAGLATLTRYTGIALVPLGILAALWPGAGNPWRNRRLRAVGAFAVGTLVVFAPWWAFTAASGAPPTLRFYHNLAYEVFARSRGITWDDYQMSLEKEFPTFRSVLERDPGAVVQRLFANTYEHVAQAAKDLWLAPLTILAAIGLVLWIARRLPGVGPAVALGALVYASLVPAFYANRYHLPLVPVAAMLAGGALAAPRALPGLASLVPGVGRALAWVVLPLAFLGAIYVQGRATVQDVEYMATQVPTDLPAVAEALRKDWHGEGKPRLIARKPHLSYYAHAEPIAFAPLDSLEALARYAKEQHADYLFISWPEALLRPSFAFLLVPEFAPEGLSVVAAGPNGHSALYRIGPTFGDRMPDWYPLEWTWRAGEGMIRIAPNDPEYWLAAGEGRHARREYAAALEAYDQALRLKPGWARAFADLGNLFADQGDFVKAVQAYEAAFNAGSREPRLLRNLGVAAAQAGDFRRSEQVLSAYLSQTNDPAMANFLEQVREQIAASGGR